MSDPPEKEHEPLSNRPLSVRHQVEKPSAPEVRIASKELYKIVKPLERIEKKLTEKEVELSEEDKDLPELPPIFPEPFPFFIDRKCITFAGRVGDEDVVAYFMIRNTSHFPYMFKLKASDNQKFRFKPVCGIVTALEEAECQVIFQGQLIPDLFTEWISIHAMALDIEQPNILQAFASRSSYVSRQKVYCDFAYVEDVEKIEMKRSDMVLRGNKKLLSLLGETVLKGWQKAEEARKAEKKGKKEESSNSDDGEDVASERCSQNSRNHRETNQEWWEKYQERQEKKKKTALKRMEQKKEREKRRAAEARQRN